MNLLPSKNIQFSSEEAEAVLNGDFSFKINDGKNVNTYKISSWVIGVAVGLIVLVAIFYIMKQVKNKNVIGPANNKNKNPKSISYAKI